MQACSCNSSNKNISFTFDSGTLCKRVLRVLSKGIYILGSTPSGNWVVSAVFSVKYIIRIKTKISVLRFRVFGDLFSTDDLHVSRIDLHFRLISFFPG